MTAIALTIAGSDSGGGAGVQADLKAFSALGVYGASALTAITAQNTRGVFAVECLSPAMIGMLGGADQIAAVAKALQARSVPIVLDPVMVAKSGDRLLAHDALQALRSQLLPLATVLTPNLPEAGDLLGADPAQDMAAQQAQGQSLRDLGPDWVLMKGGHGAGPDCHDLLIGPQVHRFSAPRLTTQNTHGTGCTLSAAIAAYLAKGVGVPEAVACAHSYLQRALAQADRLAIGKGHGPVHHFHQWW